MPRPQGLAPEDQDWPEAWGKRIGAVLGPLLVLAALWFVWHLATPQLPA